VLGPKKQGGRGKGEGKKNRAKGNLRSAAKSKKRLSSWSITPDPALALNNQYPQTGGSKKDNLDGAQTAGDLGTKSVQLEGMERSQVDLR